MNTKAPPGQSYRDRVRIPRILGDAQGIGEETSTQAAFSSRDFRINWLAVIDGRANVSDRLSLDGRFGLARTRTGRCVSRARFLAESTIQAGSPNRCDRTSDIDTDHATEALAAGSVPPRFRGPISVIESSRPHANVRDLRGRIRGSGYIRSTSTCKGPMHMIIRKRLKYTALIALLFASGGAYADDPTGVLLRERMSDQVLTPEQRAGLPAFSDVGPCQVGMQSESCPNRQGYRCIPIR